ncbi:MAG TPA: biotin-independent malonate decarboxylase subunit gamma [Steroidobacteraceae bacterium]|nr:biotin-independent malonate decarboxylase subunit gamma [Steroidobacteraceae bacterium]
MSTAAAPSERGLRWFQALTGGQQGLLPGTTRTVRVADSPIGREPARYLAVVPDAQNRFPRARGGEVGLDEAWALARQVRRTIAEDGGASPRAIIAIVDVASQAYGRREELLGIHLAGAAAADAYASARLAGHPVIALLVGKAMSGAFLTHGYQANRILALDSPEVLVHAMSKESAARVTRRSVEALEELGRSITPMAYDVRSFASLGLLHTLIEGINAEAPGTDDVERVRAELAAAIADARAGARDLSSRLTSQAARTTRSASIEVRRRLAQSWDVP